MKIKASKKFFGLPSTFGASGRKRGFALAAIFIAYNLLLLALALGVFNTLVPEALREKVTDRIALVQMPVNLVRGKTASPEKFNIDIKHKHLRKLDYVRNMSLQNDRLYDSKENSVPAVINYNGKAYRVELNIKGLLRAHWEDEDMYSLKVKVKDGKTIMGMKSFALQHPGTRSYINEWILHQLYSDAGIMSLRYDFIEVSINGKPSHIYALEEGFEKRLVEFNRLKEGPIIKFQSSFSQDPNNLTREVYSIGVPQDLWAAAILPMPQNATLADSVKAPLFEKAKSLLEAYRQNELSTSEVFDIDKLATFFALSDLFGSHHLATLDNIRFYYNPTTSLVEPITHDNDHLERLSQNGLLGAEKLIGRQIEHGPSEYSQGGWLTRTHWFEMVFKDPAFYEAYVKELERIAQPQFLDDFFEKHESQLLAKKKILHRDYPILKLDPSNILYGNQDYIRNALNGEQLINVYYHPDTGGLRLDVTNVCNLPVEIVGARIGDATTLPLSGPAEIIQAKVDQAPVSIHTLRFDLPENLELTPSLLEKIEVDCRILGAGKIVTARVLPYPVMQEGLQIADLTGLAPNTGDFAFLSVDEQRRQIRFAAGTHQLDKNLVIPPGYQVLAGKGTEIDLINNAGIFSWSPVFFIGSEAEPIVIYSSNATGRGMMIVNAGQESNLQYVHFYGLSNPVLEEKAHPAAVAFHHSPVLIDHCFFGNNRGGDYYLNIVRSRYSIDQTVFHHAKANAFRADFSEGAVRGSRFVASGRNAVDFSGSKAVVDNIRIVGSAVNGISADQKSLLEIRSASIEHADVALTSTNLSEINIEEISIRDCRIRYAAYQKNAEFGPATIRIKKSPQTSGQAKNLIEEQSTLVIAAKKMKSTAAKGEVESMLSAVH